MFANTLLIQISLAPAEAQAAGQMEVQFGITLDSFLIDEDIVLHDPLPLPHIPL
ncbi:hypothetical protein D3C87_2053210 [compost metagenome]